MGVPLQVYNLNLVILVVNCTFGFKKYIMINFEYKNKKKDMPRTLYNSKIYQSIKPTKTNDVCLLLSDDF